MDIFKEVLWYTYKDDKSKWFKLTLSQVQEILEENKQGNTVEGLEEYDAENIEETKIDFENVVGQDSLTRFDEPKQKSKRRKNNHSRNKPAKKVHLRNNTAKDETEVNGNKKPVKKPNHARKPNINKTKRENINPNTKVEGKSNPNQKKKARPQRKKPQSESSSQKEAVSTKVINNASKTIEGTVNTGKPKPKRRNNNRKKPNKPTNGPAKSE